MTAGAARQSARLAFTPQGDLGKRGAAPGVLLSRTTESGEAK